MTSYISAELRRLVESRSGLCCEYCRIPEAATFLGCQVDHVIAEKHGGRTVAANLAYACTICNRRKGSDIASLSPITGKLTPLFDPRIDSWADHFRLNEAVIEARTEIGLATARLLGFNDLDRILERTALQAVGLYPLT